MTAENNHYISRRQFILTALAGMSALTIGGCDSAKSKVAQQLTKTIADPDVTRRFGRLYLDAHPGEADLERLLATIDRRLKESHGRGIYHDNPQQLAEHLDRQVRDDFRRGEMVKVDNWLLSRTEARIYACYALL